MSSIYLLYRNILERSTVTVTSEDSDYPKWRLHDRDVGKKYKGTSIANHTIHIDQGASVQYDVDTLIIPDGHNLYGGAQLDWEYSTDDSSWYDMVTAWAGASGQIAKEAASAQNKRYWRLVMTSLAANPEIPELWMGRRVELQDVIAWGYLDGLRGNVQREDSLSGRPFFLERGEEREYRNYVCKLRSSSVAADLEAFFTHSRGKPFWLKDLDGNWYFMSLVDPNIGPFGRPSLNRYDLQLEMLEVLA
ncbi:MAG: hypothetical protein JRJ66_01430 [Deltaproteobacteria bacterium]|nr:hypothetical protein [Deltaproteobacteria bacterium]MBW2081693.1 hypothetical protein [Deltaproteobacteria bacterium]MBW2298888.1 hypothetical protein [Deltaproteobacteria bacterium]